MKKYLQLLLALVMVYASQAQDPVYPPAPAAAPNIIAAECFVDIDPGAGAATAIPVSAGFNISNAGAVVNVNGLSNGVHRLFLRTRDANGTWSIANQKDFLYDAALVYHTAAPAPQNITAAEYFIDSDPGPGTGVAIPISAGLDLANVSVSVNTASLSNGVHKLYIRSRGNEGLWSLLATRDFIVNFDPAYPVVPAAAKNITAGEYYFDTDPGAGKGKAIALTPGLDLADVSATINTAGLSIGTHRLYLRTRNGDAVWSLTTEGEMIVNVDYNYPSPPVAAKNISAAEYFIDTDPGAGSGTAISVTPGIDLANIPVTVNTAGLADGRHTLYLRTKSQEGRWSLSGTDSIYVGLRLPSWAISPAGGHDFGSVQAGSPVSYTFTVNNTGSIPVVLGSASSSDQAFAISFTAGVSIPAGGSVNLPVIFTPTAVAAYSSRIKITSSAGGPDTVTTVVTGVGYIAGTPPVLSYPAPAPYNGTRGVSADAGQPGLYTYKVLYKSANGRAPQANYPQVGIDRNGDGDFADAGEGLYTMTKDGSSTDYATGVVYTYSVNHPDYSSTLGYQFFAIDDQGNTATAGNTAYKSGPVITYQLLDLKIFASDISFSKTNPLPGESFTLTANVTNSSAYNVSNVPVKFYKDTILLDSAIIPSVNAFSSASLTKTFSFPVDGFYPVKVWIDSSRTLSESNYLNNYAIRPINIGKVVLPGGINVTTSASLQSCPQAVLISGTAVYFGTSSPTAVAGADVTITIGSQTYKTTTDANGSYSYLLSGPVCGAVLAYTVTVTDFTFTSLPKAGGIDVPCPAPNACVITPQPGVTLTPAFSPSPCAKVVGSSGPVNITVTYRARNISNMWSLWDKILQDTVKIFKDGVLIQTYWSVDGSTSPGDTKTIPVLVTLNTGGANIITAEQSYVYDEFFQNEDNFYHGILTHHTGSASTTMIADDNGPDLTILGFSQSGLTAFDFADANISCGDAGAHTVEIWDSIPGGLRKLIKTYAVAPLAARTQQNLSFSDSTLATGDHYITIITDAGNAVTEANENNNVFTTKLVFPMTDLTVAAIRPSYTSSGTGSKLTLSATIVNSGKRTGPFFVSFRMNGTLIGSNVPVTQMADKSSLTVVSDPYTVTSADHACPQTILVTADETGVVTETSETNNTAQLSFGSDLAPYMLGGELGSVSNPVVVRTNVNTTFNPLIRNIGSRDVSGVSVRYSLGAVRIGAETLGLVRAGEPLAAKGSFSHIFTTAGDYTVSVAADTANDICEFDEGNNTGNFYIHVVETNPDLEVLSQYISPSSLNPNPGQAISIVGTVKNIGLKPSQANVLRFMVDDVQLGADVPLNALQPGRDTTVAATALYSSLITGVKTMAIVVDPSNILVEERDDNNEATRSLIVGDAPDLARIKAGSITFNPNGFSSGDSVLVSYAIKNSGSQPGSAWVRFLIMDAGGGLTAIDSVAFTLDGGANTLISKKMQFNVDRGTVIAQIVNGGPMEFDLLNNDDTLQFSTIVGLKANSTVTGDLDMKAGVADLLPGWIGGKLMLGDYDLVVNGKVTNFDTAHFIITDGTGRLRFVNNSAANTFPVGAALNSPNFVRIDNTGTPDHFAVRVLPYVLRGGTGGDTVRTLAVNRTWLLEEDVPGGSNASVELFWSHADELPAFDGLSSRLAHYEGSWQIGDLAAALADTNGQYSRSQAGYTRFSPFTVISGSGVNLPLHLLQFGVKRQGADAMLDWQSSNEVNTRAFIIQHSLHGQGFSDMGEVAALNRPGTNDYRFLDAAVGEGLHAYRLKMVDLDGTAVYSEIQSIRFGKGAGLQVYPNPAEQFVMVTGLDAAGILEIAGSDGKVIRRLAVTGTSLAIDLGRLAAGAYMIRYVNQDRTAVQMILKK